MRIRRPLPASRFRGFVLLIVLWMGMGAALANQIEKFSGDGVLIRRGVRTVIWEGMQLQAGDLVETGAVGEALIRFTGGMGLIVRPGSRIAIEEAPTLGQESLWINLMRGALRYASKTAADASKRKIRFTSNGAVLGVRGTDFDLIYLDESQARQRGTLAGVYVLVRTGLVEIGLGTPNAIAVGANQSALLDTQNVATLSNGLTSAPATAGLSGVQVAAAGVDESAVAAQQAAQRQAQQLSQAQQAADAPRTRSISEGARPGAAPPQASAAPARIAPYMRSPSAIALSRISISKGALDRLLNDQ
jgi:hypothetical protein